MARSITDAELKEMRKDIKEIKQFIKKLEIQDPKIIELPEELTEHHRKIMEYIEKHPEINKEDLVKNLDLSRKTIFKNIDDLKRWQIINDDVNPYNRQTRSLTINNDSILFSLIKNLDNFHDAFVEFLEKSSSRIYKQYGQDSNQSLKLSTISYHIFSYLIHSYIWRLILIYPNLTSDKNILTKLTVTIILKLLSLQTHLPLLKVENISNNYMIEFLKISALNGTRFLNGFYQNIKELEIEKESISLLDAIWNMNKEIQPYAYPELVYDEISKEFDLSNDDWRQFIDLINKFPDTLFKNKNSNILDENTLNKITDYITNKK